MTNVHKVFECKIYFKLTVIDDVRDSTLRDLDGLSSLLHRAGSCDAPKSFVYVGTRKVTWEVYIFIHTVRGCTMLT